MAVARSFRTLLADLLDLVDENTACFKSHVESLPAQERRVYLALAALWKPATAREVAERARMGTSKCSAQLRRPMERGVVIDAGGTDRRRQYYVSERQMQRVISTTQGSGVHRSSLPSRPKPCKPRTSDPRRRRLPLRVEAGGGLVESAQPSGLRPVQRAASIGKGRPWQSRPRATTRDS